MATFIKKIPYICNEGISYNKIRCWNYSFAFVVLWVERVVVPHKRLSTTLLRPTEQQTRKRKFSSTSRRKRKNIRGFSQLILNLYTEFLIICCRWKIKSVFTPQNNPVYIYMYYILSQKSSETFLGCNNLSVWHKLINYAFQLLIYNNSDGLYTDDDAKYVWFNYHTIGYAILLR